MVRAGTIITSNKTVERSESVSKTEALFKPFELKKGVTLDNRFVLSPMVTNSSTKEGHITEDDLKYAERRACCSPSNYRGGIREQARPAIRVWF